MTDHVYTDSDGHRIYVYDGLITIQPGEDMPNAAVHAPTGEDAVALARAILSAAGHTGHTGHVVIDRADLPDTRAATYRGAMSMRTRAAAIAADDTPGDLGIANDILALPLLPDSDEPDDDPRFPARGGDFIDDADRVPRGEYVHIEYGEWDASGHECGDIDPAHGDCEQPVMHRTVTAAYWDRRVLLGTELELHADHIGRIWDDEAEEEGGGDSSRTEAHREMLREALGAGYGASWSRLVRQVRELVAAGKDGAPPEEAPRG